MATAKPETIRQWYQRSSLSPIPHATKPVIITPAVRAIVEQAFNALDVYAYQDIARNPQDICQIIRYTDEENYDTEWAAEQKVPWNFVSDQVIRNVIQFMDLTEILGVPLTVESEGEKMGRRFMDEILREERVRFGSK